MKVLTIVLVGGAAKIAADGFFGVLALLRLYTRPMGHQKNDFNARVPFIKAAWQGEAIGLLLTLVFWP